jgi:hypothetical protein
MIKELSQETPQYLGKIPIKLRRVGNKLQF